MPSSFGRPAGGPPRPVARAFTLFGQRIAAEPISPGLYIVATPIGNLGDVTLRALNVLAAADRIVCEDSRVTRRLLDAYGIATPTGLYHEHNARRVRPRLLSQLDEGASLALVSDAGMPLISDPGYKLVEEAARAGHAVHPVPGASATLAALAASGLPTDRFFFEGFLPSKRTARRKRLDELKQVPATLIFFESPRRLAAALEDLADCLGPRPAAIARELTKRFEEVRRDSLDALARSLTGAETVKGEIVIVVAPPGDGPGEEIDLDAILNTLLETMSVRDAANAAAQETGVSRKAAYARALELSGKQS